MPEPGVAVGAVTTMPSMPVCTPVESVPSNVDAPAIAGTRSASAIRSFFILMISEAYIASLDCTP